MKINESHEELNIFNILTGTKSTNPQHNSNYSLFNELLQKNSEINKKSSIQKLDVSPEYSENLNEKIKETTTTINEQKNITLTSNTHENLTLMLQLKRVQAA